MRHHQEKTGVEVYVLPPISEMILLIELKIVQKYLFQHEPIRRHGGRDVSLVLMDLEEHNRTVVEKLLHILTDFFFTCHFL